MPETKGAETRGVQDHRATVLVLIGLCICLPHLLRAVGPFPDPLLPEQGRQRLIWLERDVGQASGLYWLADPAEEWPQLLAPFGQPAPRTTLPLSPDLPLPAFRLREAGPPRAIPLPAQAAPLCMQKIPINQAGLETLLTIPGLGRRLASSIIAHRERSGAIKDRAALMAIPGIGEKKSVLVEMYISYE